jgi:hypothetical protein
VGTTWLADGAAAALSPHGAHADGQPEAASRRRSSNDVIRPRIALAAIVGGLASQTLPGPDRLETLRLIALAVT